MEAVVDPVACVGTRGDTCRWALICVRKCDRTEASPLGGPHAQ